MAIKVEIIEVEPKEKEDEYPCLKIDKVGIIVFFIAPKMGWVEKGNYSPIGWYSKNWDMTTFTPFKGKLVKSNI